MKKKIVIIYLLLIISSLFILNVNAVSENTIDIKYEVKIKNDIFYETIVYKISNYNESGNKGKELANIIFNDIPAIPFQESFIETEPDIPAKYYQKIVQQEGDEYIITLEYTYKPDEFWYSTSMNKCFKRYSFYYIEKNYEFKGENLSKCNYVNSIEIKIVPDKNKTITSDNEALLWKVNPDNMSSFKINFKISKDDKEKTQQPNPTPNKNENPNNNPSNNVFDNIFSAEDGFNALTIVLILLLILLLGFVVFLILQVKNKRNNKI